MGSQGGKRRIGDLLLGEGLLSEQALERALAAQARTQSEVRLGSALLGLGIITEDALANALSRAHGCAAVGAAELDAADPAAVELLSSARAYRLNAMPYALDKKTLRVAFADPSNIAALDEVAAVTGCRIVPAVATEVRLMEAHRKHYGRVLSRHFVGILRRLDAKEPVAIVDEAPVVPPPPPRFQDDPVAADAIESPEVEASAPPMPADAVSQEAGTLDRYSDDYSLTDFLAEALDGVSLEDLWQAGGFDEDLPLDLGEPLSENDSLENTRPTRRTKRAKEDTPPPRDLGASA